METLRRPWHAPTAVLLLVACLGAGLGVGSAQGAKAEAAGGFQRLSPRVWAFVAEDDRSSNGALFVGDERALAVDPGLTPAVARRFLAEARRLTDRPLQTVLLTHWHPDHALGVVCLQERRFDLVAHPWTRRRLAEEGAHLLARMGEGARDAGERAALERCRIDLPDALLPSRKVFDLGGHRVEVFHPGPAHTRGDLVVWSPEEKVLVTGDLFLRDSCPSMGEGSVVAWVGLLDSLAVLQPEHVVPGHFAPGGLADLLRFRDYLAAQVETVQALLEEGVAVEDVPDRVDFPRFAAFLQFPRYGATFAANAAVVADELLARPPRRGTLAGFAVTAVVKAGKNPHQIGFSADGATAYVAAAGSDRITLIDTRTHEVTRVLDIEGVPLGVAALAAGRGLAVARFRSQEVWRVDPLTGARLAGVVTGDGPSLLVGPLPGDRYLVSAEGADRLQVLAAEDFTLQENFPTGRRPFPPAATSDGRLAFVPNHDDGTVTVVDLWNHRVVDTVEVGERPTGGAVLPGDRTYAVAVRGEDRIAFINTASHAVTGSLEAGIGRSPFSVVVSPDGRLAFVNNTASHDVSVVALPERRVVARIPVGEIPIVMAVHPAGESLWVSSEGSHEVTVVTIPERWRRVRDGDEPGRQRPLQPTGTAAQAAPSAVAEAGATSGTHATAVTEVAVLGMIHGRHRTSQRWGLDAVRETIRRFHPDAVCAEIPPDRWERIWTDYAERGVIEDPRVRHFPEYTDVLLPLAVEMGFPIIPCAAWTQEMSDLRQARLREFETDPAWAEKKREYEARTAEVQRRYNQSLDDIDNPFVIHSDEYDARMEEELGVYDATLNDWIGPGGWTNINEAHMRLIDAAIAAHPGQRLLITFGAGHKYWFLAHLGGRKDVRLVDVRPYLPAAGE